MKKPNILFYFSDQQRADTCGCYGQELAITPVLDQLAQEGVRFDLAFTPQPVCGPCRAMFQTGLYPTEIDCFRNNKALPLDVPTLGKYFTKAGYETAYVGKWHLASEGEPENVPILDFQTTPIPRERRGGYQGFWRAVDLLEFTSDAYGGYLFDEHMQEVQFSGYRADCMTDFALEFLQQRPLDKPFFLTVSQIEPHHQNNAHHYQGPKGSKEKFANFTVPVDLQGLEGDYKEEYPDYLGACNSVDTNLGRIIELLKEQGVYEDTIIVYTSDHGSHFKTRNQDAHLCGFDDYKRTGHDAALRVPLVIRGGAYAGGKVVHELVSTAGVAKSLLAMAGISEERPMAGENFLDVQEGNLPNRKNEVFAQISESRVGRVLRTADFTYGVYAPGKDGGIYAKSSTYADDYLYDLTKDPAQQQNRVTDPAYYKVKEQLRAKLLEHIAEVEYKGVQGVVTIVD